MPFVENSGGAGGSGTVTSVTATDTSIVVAGTAVAPTVATGTLDVIATNHAAAADWSNNSHKITSLAAATLATDAARFGQVPDGSNGQSGPVSPTAPGWTGIATAFAANRVNAARFVPRKAITVSNIVFRTIGVGTGNMDAGILDAAGNRLASTGSTAGKKAATTTQTVALTASVGLVAGTTYYLVIESDTGDGTFLAANFGVASGVESLFGGTIGLAEAFIKDTTFPIPVAVAVGFTSNANGPVCALT